MISHLGVDWFDESCSDIQDRSQSKAAVLVLQLQKCAYTLNKKVLDEDYQAKSLSPLIAEEKRKV